MTWSKVAVIALVIALGFGAALYMQAVRKGEAPVVLPAPVTAVPQKLPKQEVTIDLATVVQRIETLNRNTVRLSGILMEITYGELCHAAPSPQKRAECLSIVREVQR